MLSIRRTWQPLLIWKVQLSFSPHSQRQSNAIETQMGPVAAPARQETGSVPNSSTWTSHGHPACTISTVHNQHWKWSGLRATQAAAAVALPTSAFWSRVIFTLELNPTLIAKHICNQYLLKQHHQITKMKVMRGKGGEWFCMHGWYFGWMAVYASMFSSSSFKAFVAEATISLIWETRAPKRDAADMKRNMQKTCQVSLSASPYTHQIGQLIRKKKGR